MQGTILQVNTSRGGVPKYPVLQAQVGPLGIEGDAVAHPRFHGGPNQALLLIAQEAIDLLKEEGYPLFRGALGENLTTQGLDFRQWRLGQRYRVGTCVIEFSKIRVPCGTLDVYGPGIQQRMYDKQVKAGKTTSELWGRSGCYARVLQSGEIAPGDTILLADQVV